MPCQQHEANVRSVVRGTIDQPLLPVSDTPFKW
jgi:hypothetical protein